MNSRPWLITRTEMDRRQGHAGPLIDRDALRRDLAATEPGPNLRPQTVAVLKERLACARQEAERRLLADGHGTKCAEGLSRTLDEIISALFDLTRSKDF